MKYLPTRFNFSTYCFEVKCPKQKEEKVSVSKCGKCISFQGIEPDNNDIEHILCSGSNNNA